MSRSALVRAPRICEADDVIIYPTTPSEPLCPAPGCGHPKGGAISKGWSDWYGGGYIYQCVECGAGMLDNDDDTPGGNNDE